MSLSNIKAFLHYELVINKKAFYTYFLIGSILGFMFVYNLLPRRLPSGGTPPQFDVQLVLISFSYTYYYYILLMLFYLLPKRDKIVAINGMTGNELKKAFLFFIFYSLIIFALPLISIVCYSCFIHNMYDFYKVILIIVVYFITVIFNFMFIFLLMAILNNRNNIIAFVTLLFFFIIFSFGPIIVYEVAEHYHLCTRDISTKLSGKFLIDTILWNNVINEQNVPIKIDVSDKYHCLFSFFFNILDIYLVFAGFFSLIFLWYYFDSIKVENYLRRIPLFKEMASKSEPERPGPATISGDKTITQA